MAYVNPLLAPESAREEIREVSEQLNIMDHDFRYDPLYGVAMLKVSFNMRPQRWVGFDDILKDTLHELEVDEKDLDVYINENRSNLEMACKMIGI